MKCPKCQIENESTSSFCINCGCNLQTGLFNQELPEKKYRDILVIISLSYMIFFGMTWFIIPKVLDQWYLKVRYLNMTLNMIQALMPIILALSLKKSRYKIIFVLISLLFAAIIGFDIMKALIQ